MISEIVLPEELARSARNLEQRFQLLRVPTRKVALAEWDSLAPSIQKFVPDWIPTLLASYSLVGGVLESSESSDPEGFCRFFSLIDADEYKKVLSSRDGILEQEILAAGFVPISHEQSGDMWVTSIKGGPSSPIYLYSLSGRKNIFASSRLALLMAAMAVSDLSFHDNRAVTSVMWHPEK
jgi:hypothetical protein